MGRAPHACAALHTSNGTSVSGVTFPDLLIVDVKGKKIYSIAVVSTEC
jgi:hypothetical protein